MRVEYHKSWSNHLWRDMEYKTYGDRGHALLVFPSQDGRFWDMEGFNMIHVMSPFIEQGRIRVICCDGIDWEALSSKDWDKGKRMWMQERYFRYITEELIPEVSYWQGETFMCTGCSLGAYQAANSFFRRPDIFDTVIALSGLYDTRYFMGDYCDDNVYNNSPLRYLRNMPSDHHYWDMYRNRRIVVCIGQGKWEDDGLPETRELDTILHEHGVNNSWFEYWGTDVYHDWPWWRKQIVYFLERLV